MFIDFRWLLMFIEVFVDVKMELVAINDRQETLGIFSWYFKTTAWWLQDFGWSLLEHYLQMKDFHSHVWLPEGSSSLSLFFQFLEDTGAFFWAYTGRQLRRSSFHWWFIGETSEMMRYFSREVDAAKRGTCTWTAWYRGPPCRWICPSMAESHGWLLDPLNESISEWIMISMADFNNGYPLVI